MTGSPEAEGSRPASGFRELLSLISCVCRMRAVMLETRDRSGFYSVSAFGMVQGAAGLWEVLLEGGASCPGFVGWGGLATERQGPSARVESPSLCGVDRAALLTAGLGRPRGSGGAPARGALLAKLIREGAEAQ